MTWNRARNPQEALSQLHEEQGGLRQADPPLSLTAALTAIQEHSWRFAKTMPEAPHWYTRRQDWNDDATFDALVQLIRREGVIRYFGRWPYLEFDLDGHTYWTMGYPVWDTTIINRRPT